MKCPFRINTTSTTSSNCVGNQVYVVREFGDCYTDECPCFYRDENYADKCSRCNGPEEEL